jgi:hypothetical protein
MGHRTCRPALMLLALVPLLAAGACGRTGSSKTSMEAIDPDLAWLLESVHVYRQVGLFEEDANLSDAALAQKLSRRYAREHERPFNPSDDWAELYLLALDENRFWWTDLEADVCRENNVYVRVLQEWARISRGSFSPEGIEETWDTDEGPVNVSFVLNAKRHVIHPLYLGDWIDILVLDTINDLIEASGFRFEYYPVGESQIAFVIVLTPEEKELLERERGDLFTP